MGTTIRLSGCATAFLPPTRGVHALFARSSDCARHLSKSLGYCQSLNLFFRLTGKDERR